MPPHGLLFGAVPLRGSLVRSFSRKNPFTGNPRLTRSLQTERYSAFTPPNPSELGKPRPPPSVKSLRRRRRLRNFLVYFTLIVGGGYVVDRQFYASSIARSLRTFRTTITVGLDYKINFRAHPWFVDNIEELHARNARRVFSLLRENGGLYLKIGQAIAMQSAVLPREFQEMFARMFDDAPQNEWEIVQKVVQEDFGKSIEEVFGVSFDGDESKGIMERTARASASVAQVHWARLRDGREVAIKIQKQEIASQVGWDLWAFKVVAAFQSWWFDLPFSSLVPYITERLMLETDFVNEANNAEEMARLVSGEPRLRGRVYIPKVYRELSSRRVMTAEWIEGVRLWDQKSIEKPWYGGWRQGSPGAKGTSLPPPSSETFMSPPSNYPNDEELKPKRDEWRGRTGKGGLGVSLKSVMQTIVDLFSAQMFLWGTVHCDPHPGNIFIRRQPNGEPEIVLIDHGLYVHMDPKFRQQYALLWKSLMSFDNQTIKEIVSSWGINAPDFFASATLMRPYTGGDNSTSAVLRKELEGKDPAERHYAMQQHMRSQMREMLADEKKWPRELIFIGRELRILQGLNQRLGTPVNRLKITGLWASRALAESRDIPLQQRTVNWGKHMIFRLVLFTTDLAFWYSKIRQWIGWGKGLEDDLEESMKRHAKDMGVDLNHNVFEG